MYFIYLFILFIVVQGHVSQIRKNKIFLLKQLNPINAINIIISSYLSNRYINLNLNEAI